MLCSISVSFLFYVPFTFLLITSMNFVLFIVFSQLFSISSAGECIKKDVDIRYNNSMTEEENRSQYHLADTSIMCYNLLYKSAAPEEFTTCPPYYFDVKFTPVLVANTEKNEHPYVTVNISVLSHVPVEVISIQYECNHAPADQEDPYCNNPEILVHVDSKVVQPCRALHLNGSVPQIPFRFGYSCFRMFAMSQYQVNISLLPQKCKMSFVISAPVHSHLFPAELTLAFENKHLERNAIPWTPMLAVSTDLDHGVLVQVGVPSGYPYKNIDVSFARKDEYGDDEKVQRIMSNQDLTIPFSQDGALWRNVRPGSYVAYAYVRRHDCQLICDDGRLTCVICQHTTINFTVDDFKGAFHWKTIRWIQDYKYHLAAATLLICLSVSSVIYFLYKYTRKRNIMRTRDIELTGRPTVLILYADDCKEHTDVVFCLCRTLERLANAQIYIDQKELVKPGIQPSRWLVDTISRCEFVLIVLSPTSPLLLNAHSLIERRPFPDLFKTSVNMVICAASTTADSNRFAIVRLPYSPPVPPQLELLGLNTFKVPTDLARLTAFLHHVALQSANITHIDQSDEVSQLNSKISTMHELIDKQPNWMDSKVEMKSSLPSGSFDLNSLVGVPSQPTSHAERVRDSERFGLLPPDEDDKEEDAHSNYGLLPPDSDSDEN